MSTISRNTPNVSHDNRPELRAQIEQDKAQLKKVESRISFATDEIEKIQGQIQKLVSDKGSTLRKAQLKEIGENVDAGWTKLTGTFARKLADLAGAIGKRSVTVTTVDIEKDPKAIKTSETLRAAAGRIDKDIQTYKDQLVTWTQALGDLQDSRRDLKDSIQEHTRALAREWGHVIGQGVSDKIHAGLELVGATATAVAGFGGDLLRGAQKKVFSGIKQVSFAVANYAAEKELSGARGDTSKLSGLKAGPALEASIANALSKSPVPVPVEKKLAEEPLPTLQPAEVFPQLVRELAKTKQAQLPEGVELVDARDIYKLPAPKTGRDWVAMLAGVDYSKIGQEIGGGQRLRERDVDQALQDLGASKAMPYKNRTAKDVKHSIEKRYGLKEGAKLHDIRTEVDRRASANVSPFATVDELLKRLEALGVSSNATPNQILQKSAFGIDVLA